MGATHDDDHEYSPLQPDDYSSLQLQPDDEQQQVEPSLEEKICVCIVLFIAASALLTLVAAGIVGIGGLFFYMDQAWGQYPHYYVSVDSVTGLDPATDLGKPSLHPQFNLTVRVASWGIWDEECFMPGMYFAVSYRGVPLAATPTLMERQFCAEPGKAADHPLVAGGVGVVVPGSVLDALAMDMRAGTLILDVELRDWGRRSCGMRALGDTAAIQTECHNYYL